MAVAFAIYLAIGLFVGRSAGKDYDSYFLSGRSMPWWLLGTSMVATTFATDTPNLVTGIVRRDGVFGNWIWWSFLLTGTTTVFLYAKLWRRSDVLTDIEFYELRYSGKPAAFLRGFRAVYLGVFFNVVIMANVTLAAIKIGGVMLGLTPLQTIAIASVVTVAYSMVGGLTGVLLTDLVQFIIAMVGAVWAAVHVVNLPQVGGLSNLLAHPNVAGNLDLLPDLSKVSSETFAAVFLFPLLIQWWSAYYPGAEPGGYPSAGPLPHLFEVWKAGAPSIDLLAPDIYFPNTTTMAGVNYSTVDDWVFLHNSTLAGGTNQIWGVLCDCEMFDNRLASRNTANMIEFANITRAAGYKYAVVSDGLLGAGLNGGFCGIGATANNCDMGANGNLNAIVTNVDQFLISVGLPPPKGYTFATSMTKYWSMIGAPGTFPQGHVILQFVLGAWPAGTSVRNATDARAFAIANNVGGVVLAPVFAQMGGSATRCTNQKIQTLLFGTFTSPMDPGCQP